MAFQMTCLHACHVELLTCRAGLIPEHVTMMQQEMGNEGQGALFVGVVNADGPAGNCGCG